MRSTGSGDWGRTVQQTNWRPGQNWTAVCPLSSKINDPLVRLILASLSDPNWKLGRKIGTDYHVGKPVTRSGKIVQFENLKTYEIQRMEISVKIVN